MRRPVISPGSVEPGRPSWTDRDEQLSAGFHELTCPGCGLSVLVRKMHAGQTSTQWTRSPTCAHLARDAIGRPGEHCPVLAGAVGAAVRSGELPTEPR